MKGINLGLAALIGLAVAARPTPAEPKPSKDAARPPDIQKTLDDIKQTLGFVPDYVRAIPPEILPAFWEVEKFEASKTSLDPKVKELIGLAVASQIPCEYCTYFHRAAARAHGATDAEIKEAVAMASITRMGSTLMNGLDVDKERFRRDVDRATKATRQSAQKAMKR